MSRRFIITLGTLLSLPLQATSILAPQLTNHAPIIELDISSASYSNILPVGQMVNDSWRQAPQKNASYAFTQNKLALSYRINNIELSLVKRIDYFIKTNPATANAYYLENSEQGLFPNQSVDLMVELENQQSTGITLGYLWQVQQVSGKVNLGLWYIDALRESYLQGHLTTDDSGDISGDVSFSEHYTGSNLLKRPNLASWDNHGWGSNIDVSVHWQASENLAFSLAIDDLYSQFNINDLGYSEGRASTDNSYINSDGYQSFVPLFKGLEITKDHNISVPATTTLSAAYQHQQLSYIAIAKRQANMNFVDVGISMPLGPSELTLMLDIKGLTPSVYLASKRWSFSLTTDKVNFYNAMQFNFNIAYRWLL